MRSTIAFFYDGITTADISRLLFVLLQTLSVLSTSTIVVAARLLLFSLRKSINGRIWDTCTLEEQIAYGIAEGVYDKAILDYYSSEELAELEAILTTTVT